MGVLVNIDGKVFPPQEANVSVFDRGFLYGDSVFETIRTYGGVPYAMREHLQRLAKSAGRVYIELPISLDELAAEVLAVVEQADNAESYIRVMITRGSSLATLGLPPELSEGPRRVILVTPLQAPAPDLYESGIGVVSYRTRRATDDTQAEGAKIGNYLVAVLAMKEARAAGALEALIVDAHGQVVEGATSNVFMVQGSTLVTPAESAGILPGITRAGLIQVAEELGVEVRFETPTLDQLLGAEEVFISSSIRELLPVVSVDGTSVGRGKPGPMYRKLLQGFRTHVRGRMAEAAEEPSTARNQ